jgi:hypothetical protein
MLKVLKILKNIKSFIKLWRYEVNSSYGVEGSDVW